jgi:hypothetical protein
VEYTAQQRHPPEDEHAAALVAPAAAVVKPSGHLTGLAVELRVGSPPAHHQPLGHAVTLRTRAHEKPVVLYMMLPLKLTAA